MRAWVPTHNIHSIGSTVLPYSIGTVHPSSLVYTYVLTARGLRRPYPLLCYPHPIPKGPKRGLDGHTGVFRVYSRDGPITKCVGKHYTSVTLLISSCGSVPTMHVGTPITSFPSPTSVLVVPAPYPLYILGDACTPCT